MTALSPELRQLIEGGPLAHVVTLNRDGGPQVSVVWIGLDGNDVVSGHMGMNQKLRNVQRDARIVISLEAPSEPGTFLAEHAVLRGTAEVVVGGAADLLQRLGKVYVGPDFDFPLGADPPAGFVLRTSVDRVGGVGPWATATHG